MTRPTDSSNSPKLQIKKKQIKHHIFLTDVKLKLIRTYSYNYGITRDLPSSKSIKTHQKKADEKPRRGCTIFFFNLTVKHLIDFNHISISFSWGALDLECIALVGTRAMFWLRSIYLYSFLASAVDIFLIKKLILHLAKLHLNFISMIKKHNWESLKSRIFEVNKYYQSVFSLNTVLSTNCLSTHASSS